MINSYSGNVVHIGSFLDTGAETRRPFGAVKGFRAGDWFVYPLVGEIRRDDRVIHLEPKVMDVLVALTDRAGEVLSRSELLDHVWGSRARFSDESLTRCISLLRKAFGDSRHCPRYIHTVPKRGYRFIEAVSPLQRFRFEHVR